MVGLSDRAQDLSVRQGDSDLAGAIFPIKNLVDFAIQAIVSKCCGLIWCQQFQPAGFDQRKHVCAFFQL